MLKGKQRRKVGRKTRTKDGEQKPNIRPGEEWNGMEVETRNVGVDINVGPCEAKQGMSTRA